MAKKSKSKSKSSKRALNALEIAERELGGYSSDDEPRKRDARHNGTVVNLLKKVQGGNNSDDGYSSENDGFEDEELDSDEALGSDDEFDVMNSKFSQTIRDNKKKGNLLSESDDEGGYTSIDEEDLMPLSQIWDTDSKAKGEIESDEDAHQLELQDDLSESSEEEEESTSEEESSENEDENPFDEISDDEEDIELNTITNTLLRATSSASKKKLDNYGVGDENEFVLPNINKSDVQTKLSLDDMMNVVDDKESVAKANLIKGKTSTTNVPLPQRIKQRHDRKAAYEISKDELNKWQDVVKQNRRADHLVFPANAPIEHNHSSAFTKTSEEVQSELQGKVDELLQKSNLVDPEKDSTFETLATAKMSPEEMKKRTTEMRLMRELMFREERKAKRIKKIKSKAYHRIKKKEMTKNRELAGISDESDEEHDIARARERMTLKHRTQSKWAKDMIKHGMTKDVETREEMEEMLRQAQRLKEKIIDRNSDEEDNKNISDLEKEDSDDDQKQNLGKTGVMNMAFMRNAEAREKEANRENLERLRAAERGEDINLFDDDETTGDNAENIQLNKGRRIYTPGNLEAKQELKKVMDEAKKQHDIDQESTLTSRLKKVNTKNAGDDVYEKIEKTINPNKEENDKTEEKVTELQNPWLDGSDDEGTNVKRSSKVNILDKDSSRLDKKANKISKELDKQKKKKTKERRNNEELLLDENDSNSLKIVDPYGGSDDEGHEFSFKQQDVIAEAFAGDNVVAEFHEEKKRVADDEGDKEEDVTLPGWGDWAGAGAPQKKKRKFVKKIKGVVSKDKRKDKNLQNVIINEKVNKKHVKYQSSAVPFPYESKEQYERSLRMPIGQEWTSRATHQNMIKPRIMTKPGQVIDPLKAPFK